MFFIGNDTFEGWVFLGTTTLASVLLWFANTLNGQGVIADLLSKHLTRQTGLSISFETAIVPRWKEGRIRLTNVKVEISEADALKYNCSELHLFIKEIDVKLSAHWFLAGIKIYKDYSFILTVTKERACYASYS